MHELRAEPLSSIPHGFRLDKNQPKYMFAKEIAIGQAQVVHRLTQAEIIFNM